MRISKAVKTSFLVIAATLPFAMAVVSAVPQLRPLGTTLTTVVAKLVVRASECPWYAIWGQPRFEHTRQMIERQVDRSFVLIREEGELQLWATPVGQIWISKSGKSMNGRALLGFLIADHEMLAQLYAPHTVHPGDLVLDCGAHVGVFTLRALALGASRVVAIEPDPTNLECLRRNVGNDPRVMIYPKGVWDSETTLELWESDENSGDDSVVAQTGERSVKIAVTTIDSLVAELGLTRVDFIKMDIEGAERHALVGATQTLQRFSPRLMLDSYHLPDDMPTFRGILRGFVYTCTPCDLNPSYHFVPHTTFWQRR